MFTPFEEKNYQYKSYNWFAGYPIVQAFEQYDNVEDLGLQCSPIILKVRPKVSYKFDF